MSLPPFAPLPPANIRLSLGPQEWEACLDAWLTLSELTLRLPAGQFGPVAGCNGSAAAYLNSFYSELRDLPPQDNTLRNAKALAVLKVNFRLVKRIWTEAESIPPELLNWSFLANFCHTHMKHPDAAQVHETIHELWKRSSGLLSPLLQKQKDALTTLLDAKSIENAFQSLTQLAPVMHASADIGAFFMTGSDFIDSSVGAYSRNTNDDQKKAISTVVYLGLLSLVKTEVPSFSVLSDHLYTLKSSADKSSLLADAVTNTPLIAKLRQSLSAKAPDRLSQLLDTLATYQTPSIARPRKTKPRKQAKGKGKQKTPDATLHMHRMSLVTQIQELFPDLGSGFVLKLLDEYNDDTEQAISHLLEESLPAHLSGLDRSEQAPIFETDQQTEIDHLAPRSTPPPPEPFVPDRRNVFDDDELDQLEFDTRKLYIGKQNRDDDGDQQPNKAAILSALAAFDSDDDERDDTYDVEDVGGTIDTAHPDGEPGPDLRVAQDENDRALFGAYKSSPELFGRTFDVRKGQARQALKAETGMTDEAIEGWAIMLQRDPRRLKRLEAQMGAFDGKQTELASTSYRESPGGTETEDSDAPRGGFRGRGRGRGGPRGRGRGGNVAGPSNDASTAQAQRRKEASKSSRANHNRRDQRARKMGRGGFPG